MKFFTKKEIIIISVILLLILGASLFNFRISLRRARDAQRKVDLGVIINALGAYQNDFGFYPPSLNGKIVACKKEGVEDLLNNEKIQQGEIDLFDIFRPCEWGEDELRDIFDSEYPAYLDSFPQDPQADLGASYYYISNQARFQVYTALEGRDEDAFQSEIAKRELPCGARICNFGRASGATPLEKSIEEYENELLQEKANEK
jgi:type II secretory pathway pseudopilin PulG